MRKPLNLAEIIWTLALSLLFVNVAQAQQVLSTEKTIYHSEADRLLTIRKFSVLPILDNVGGIYSRPLEQHLIDTVKKNHHWDYTQLNLAGPLVTPEELESSPGKIGALASGLDTDAILSTRLTKGPNGITLKLNMFLTRDSQLFAQAVKKNYKRFEVKELKEELNKLFEQLVKKIPYQGIVLSRSNNRVTVNLGTNDGIEEGRVVSVVQIVKANRHPKFKFLINAEKEILGKVRILKVDKTLSFGKIVMEKEKGVIQRNAKVAGLDFVRYSGSNSLQDNTSTQDDVMKRPDGLLTFGRNATAWLPKKPPTFGMAGAMFGNSLYSYNMKQNDGYDASSVFNPYVGLSLELWLTPTWTAHTALRQGILDVENPRDGSSPSDLSASMSYYEFLFGYKYRMGPTVWGPQVELLGGLANYKLSVDDSTPRALTSTTYSGFKFGLRGSVPVDLKQKWSLGANLFFFLNPSVSESPTPSGSGEDNTINQFGLFLFTKLGMNVRMQANLDFELFKTSFSNGSATSASQKYTNFNVGLYYLF